MLVRGKGEEKGEEEEAEKSKAKQRAGKTPGTREAPHIPGGNGKRPPTLEKAPENRGVNFPVAGHSPPSVWPRETSVHAEAGVRAVAWHRTEIRKPFGRSFIWGTSTQDGVQSFSRPLSILLLYIIINKNKNKNKLLTPATAGLCL